MSKITINLSFFNQNDVLVKHVEGWKKWPQQIREEFSFCIVDDCSSTPAIEVLKDTDLSDLDISIYRVAEDLICNIAGVRNLSASVCQTPWMVILDMDTIITEKLAEAMILLSENPKGNCFKFNRKVPSDPKHVKNNQPHPAVCLLRVDDYWSVGGCDEDLVGHYGQTDPIFWCRAKNILNIYLINDENIYLEYLPEGEAKINRSTKHNAELFELKRKTNNWSTDFIRFNWKKVL